MQKFIESFKRKDVRLFVLIMVVFTLGMALLLFYEVSAWWIWYIYFAVWTILEIRVAKNISLKWWHWFLIIVAILGIDWIVLEVVEILKR